MFSYCYFVTIYSIVGDSSVIDFAYILHSVCLYMGYVHSVMMVTNMLFNDEIETYLRYLPDLIQNRFTNPEMA